MILYIQYCGSSRWQFVKTIILVTVHFRFRRLDICTALSRRVSTEAWKARYTRHVYIMAATSTSNTSSSSNLDIPADDDDDDDDDDVTFMTSSVCIFAPTICNRHQLAYVHIIMACSYFSWASHLRTTGCHRSMVLTILLAALHKRAHPALTPADEGWYSIYLPRRDGRLIWPKCLITRGPGIEPMTAGSEVRRPNHCASKTPVPE